MTPTLVVETSDLAAAARTLDDEVGSRLWTRVGDALAEAAARTGMAGDDPSGLQWAQAYERAAAVAAQAAQDVTNGAFTLAALLAATAQNYARADAASTIGGRHRVDAIVADLPGPTTVTLATRFEGVGGGPPDAPYGWARVEHYARVAWPNGHQDRLLQAGAAWRRSASTLSDAADDVDQVPLRPLLDGLPEWPDICHACWSLSAQLRQVAGAHRALASSCEQYAHHLDVAHAKLLSELRVFLIESAAIEIGGTILSALTFGAAELPTQGVEASRVAATVADIVADVAELGLAVRDLVVALPLVDQLCSAVTGSLRELLGVRIVWAEVQGVAGLRVLAVARDGRTGALVHLADDADLPTELRAALESPRAGRWNDPATLEEHFKDHAADFGATTEADYAERAAAFFRRAVREGLPTKVDEDGNIRIFDPATNDFGSYTSTGATRTFFKPTSSRYWQRQKGVLVQ